MIEGYAAKQVENKNTKAPRNGQFKMINDHSCHFLLLKTLKCCSVNVERYVYFKVPSPFTAYTLNLNSIISVKDITDKHHHCCTKAQGTEVVMQGMKNIQFVWDSPY